MNSLKPQEERYYSIKKSEMSEIAKELTSLAQTNERQWSAIDVNYNGLVSLENRVADNEIDIDALKNKRDYNVDSITADTVSVRSLGASTLSADTFQTVALQSDSLDTNNITADSADITSVTSSNISTDSLEATTTTSTNTTTENLTATEVAATNLTAEVLHSDLAVVPSLQSSNISTTDIKAESVKTGTADTTHVYYSKELKVSDIESFRYIEISLDQGEAGVTYFPYTDREIEEFSVKAYLNRGCPMISYSQLDVNTIHKFYWDSKNYKLYVELTNEPQLGYIRLESKDIASYRAPRFLAELPIDTSLKTVYHQLAKRLNGWLLMGDHTVSYGLDIMGGLTADLITPDKLYSVFGRFYPAFTPKEAILADLVGNLGLGRFETSGYYIYRQTEDGKNYVEALNRIKVEEDRITWTIDTDYGYDEIVWDDFTGETAYDIGFFTTSPVWDRAVNDAFEPETYILTLHDATGPDTATVEQVHYNAITLKELELTGYDFLGYAIEEDGEVVYDAGTSFTDDIELYAIWQKVSSYLYDSTTDPLYNKESVENYTIGRRTPNYFTTPIDITWKADTEYVITQTFEYKGDGSEFDAPMGWLNGYSDGPYIGEAGYVGADASVEYLEGEDTEDGYKRYKMTWWFETSSDLTYYLNGIVASTNYECWADIYNWDTDEYWTNPKQIRICDDLEIVEMEP